MAGQKPVRITREIPEGRARTVLLELLRVMGALREAGLAVIACGGWVPCLKELSSRATTEHSLSLDIDALLPDSLHAPSKVDQLRTLICNELGYRPNIQKGFAFEKDIDIYPVELELLAISASALPDENVGRLYGERSHLSVVLIQGGHGLNGHIEDIELAYEDDRGAVHRVTVTVPDPVGFLILKSQVTYSRESPKDAYDIFYYCTRSEKAVVVSEMLRASIQEPAVRAAVQRIRDMFQHPDSKWVEMVLDHENVQGPDERDRRSRVIVSSIMKVIDGL
jgi:hypothetical protein